MHTFDQALTLPSGSTLKNRLLMSPMTTRQSFFNGTVTQNEINYYAKRAKGLGAVITGAANVEAGGKGWPGELSIADDEMLPELTQLASAIKAQGAKAIIQIFHGGRMTNAATLSGVQPVSASAVAAERPDAETPRAMTVAEIHTTIAAFGAATRRAIQAGFDGVELHGANTYLLQQFFSPHSNRRTDDYGGDREKRYTFIAEVLDAVFAAVKKYATKPFIVGYRFSPEEFETPGIRFADTLWLLTKLRETKLDYLHLSLNRYDRVARGDDYQAHSLLAYAHEALQGKIPLIGVGGVRTRTDVTNVLHDAELVAVGQQLLFDPAWPLKLASNNDAAIFTGNFADAMAYTKFETPLAEFLNERYQSTPNI
ncbi:NADH-dependent flavin oxidoreductase [Loigolactobacillus binensis]|uniref:NADH-dependent flavin oxidoreductase n=1 Tax=Loigolactobacillus binensis TaxID=2559922 RepID=A0ABW3ED57_9LACO|nr:NADH-dependent flavin oxidoreductase [Loigolactobacillus binensis]